MNNLRLYIWNANGLHWQIPEIKIFLKTQKIDILLVSETHLIYKNYIKIQEYSIYHSVHPDGKTHGDTAVIIKNTIGHYESNKYIKDYLQATSIVVRDYLGYKILILALYCPPKHNIKKKQFEDFFRLLGSRYIIGGNFNTKYTYWGSRITTIRSKELLSSIQILGLDIPYTSESQLIGLAIPGKSQTIVKGITKRRFITRSCLDLNFILQL